MLWKICFAVVFVVVVVVVSAAVAVVLVVIVHHFHGGNRERKSYQSFRTIEKCDIFNFFPAVVVYRVLYEVYFG